MACSCDLPDDGVFVRLTVEDAICPSVEGRTVKLALTRTQLSDLRREVERLLTDVGW